MPSLVLSQWLLIDERLKLPKIGIPDVGGRLCPMRGNECIVIGTAVFAHAKASAARFASDIRFCRVRCLKVALLLRFLRLTCIGGEGRDFILHASLP